jgi:hypothetical protein
MQALLISTIQNGAQGFYLTVREGITLRLPGGSSHRRLPDSLLTIA